MNNNIYDLMSHENFKDMTEQDFADMICNDIQHGLSLKIRGTGAYGNMLCDLMVDKTLRYPNDPDWEYFTFAEQIDLDTEREDDLLKNKGFIIKSPKPVNKAIKDIDGIYSGRFGQQLGDLHPYANRYRCECGNPELQGRVNNGITCPKCGTIVKRVGDRYDYYGWFVLKDHCVIHPNIYAQLEFFIGGRGKKTDKIKKTKLYNILNYTKLVDENGIEHDLDPADLPKDEPFFGIGMDEFQRRFDEIMAYYLKKNPKKQEYYDFIMSNKEKVFTHSIPCFTTCLRPFKITNKGTKNNDMHFDKINGYYTVIQKYVYKINKRDNQFDYYNKATQVYLFDIQTKLNMIYDEIVKILHDKKGKLRSLIAGRFNFTSRAVIVQNTDLRIDQIRLPYAALCIMLEQKIKNVLCRMHNYSPNEAHEHYEKALTKPDPEIKMILDSFIQNGMPILLNRNPTIAYGSILCLYVVGYTEDLTIGVPLQILKFLRADFDGDSLNIFMIINNAFWEACDDVFNPRNAMYINRADGLFNMNACVQRDTLVNFNTLLYLGRNKYSIEDWNTIRAIKERQKTELFIVDELSTNIPAGISDTDIVTQLEFMDNYGDYQELVVNGIQCIDTSILNKDNIDKHFKDIINILSDGIESVNVQNMMVAVNFSDGVSIKLSIFDYMANLMFWRLLINVGEPIDSLKLFFPDNINKGYIKSYIDNIFVRRYRNTIGFRNMNNYIDDTFSYFRYLRNYQLYLSNTLNLKDTIDLMEKYDEFKNTFYFDVDGIPFEDIKDEGMKVARKQIEYIKNSNHCFRDQFRTGEIVNAKQYKEVFVNKGTSPSGDGNVFPVAINTSFVNGGMNTPEAILIESSIGRLAKILEKKNVGPSGAFARILGLNSKDTFLNPDPNYSCDTKHFMKVTILNDQWLQLYDMRFYRVNPMGIDKLLDAQHDKHLIGQTLYFRSPMTCASHARGQGICRKCYGNLYYTNYNINIGKIAAELLSEVYTQTLLSAKHLLESLIIKMDWNPEFKELFDVNFNTIQCREDMDYKGFKIKIPSLEQDSDNDDDPNYEYYCSHFFIVYPDGAEVRMGTKIGDPIYIHQDLLGYLSTDDDDDNEEGSYTELKLKDLIKIPILFQIVVANEDLSHTMETVKKIINNKGYLVADKDEMLAKFISANIEGGIKFNASHFEVLLSNQIVDVNDPTKKPQFEYSNIGYRMITLDDALKNNPSVTTRLEYKLLAKMLITPSTYKINKASDYDLYFMVHPQEFLNNGGVITDETDLIINDKDVELHNPFGIVEEDRSKTIY